MTNEVTFETLPKAVAYLIEEVTTLKSLLANQKEPEQPAKRLPIGLPKAKEILQKAESTIYRLVGKAGTNKSHPMSFAMKPLLKFDGEQHREFKKNYAEYQNLLSMSKREREEQGITEHPQPPRHTRFVVSDVTPEGLAAIHEQNKRGICLYANELHLLRYGRQNVNAQPGASPLHIPFVADWKGGDR